MRSAQQTNPGRTLAEGAIQGQVEYEIPFEEIPSALEKVGQRRSTRKAVVRVQHL